MQNLQIFKYVRLYHKRTKRFTHSWSGVKFCDVICWLTDHTHRSIFLTRKRQF
jgi:hypothetical protein